MSITSFEWHDSDRVVYFGRGRSAEATDLFGGPGYTLLTTGRAVETVPSLADDAAAVIQVPAGDVDFVARAVLDDGVQGDRLVALGGGRVIDVAKACAAARRADGEAVEVMAVPTTLSGAEMTWIHRQAEGADEEAPRRRPAIVVNDPELSASQPTEQLAASTLNAQGHAAEAPLTSRANPVATLMAQEAARRLAAGWASSTPDRELLALGSMLAGAAIDSAWYGLHHIIAQTLVRCAGLSHGMANAVMLPHSLRATARRFPDAQADLAEAMGEDAMAFVRRIGSLVGATSLSELGVEPEALESYADSAASRPELALTPPPATREEILSLYQQAL